MVPRRLALALARSTALCRGQALGQGGQRRCAPWAVSTYNAFVRAPFLARTIQTETDAAPPGVEAFQLCTSLPQVTAPTKTQASLIPAVLSPMDVILRAHTGSGKSFALLLALLAKPRLLFRHGSAEPTPGISAWIVVPSNELAEQYMTWVRALVPPSLATTIHSVVQCVVRGEELERQRTRLLHTPPHIVVGTPTRLVELLSEKDGASLLGVETLRTLALDEADALLQLPGRFPSNKQVWRHLAHRAPGLDLLNVVMKRRATYSGGERQLTAGLERTEARRPPESVRRTQYRGAERGHNLAPALPRASGAVPLQLVCTSATANSVLRHFLGARTGWLRTNTKETRDTARFIDHTGLSEGGSASSALPREITHTCLVVDTPPSTPNAENTLQLPPLRNLVLPTRDASDALRSDRTQVVPSDGCEDHVVDPVLLEALAFAFAADGVARGLALVPARWSLRKTQAGLEALGVPVEAVKPGEQTAQRDGPVLFLLQGTSARGLDLPDLSHVFLVGMAAVGDAVQYTHLAGRVSRIGGPGGDVRLPGKVVTLLRGHTEQHPDALSRDEQRMALVYRRLGLTPRPFDLSLLTASGAAL